MSRPRRGGLGVRKAIEERQARSTQYRLTAVPVGSVVAECLDPYRRWELGHRIGVIARNSTDSVLIRWEGDEDYTRYTAGDARYKVDTNLWRITHPRAGNVFDALAGKNDDPATRLEHDRRQPGFTRGYTDLRQLNSAPVTEAEHRALTREAGNGSIAASPPTEGEDMTDEGNTMAAEQQTETSAPKERETYTAKQIATRIGTDAKTIRKFFRSAASTVEPVGQGGRYEFDADDLPKIRDEFKSWKGGKSKLAAGANSQPGGKSTKRASSKRGAAPTPVVEEDDEDEDIELDDPTEEELAELDGEIELDLDDEDED